MIKIYLIENSFLTSCEQFNMSSRCHLRGKSMMNNGNAQICTNSAHGWPINSLFFTSKQGLPTQITIYLIENSFLTSCEQFNMSSRRHLRGKSMMNNGNAQICTNSARGWPINSLLFTSKQGLPTQMT